MTIRWEIENGWLRLEGTQVAWNAVNTSAEESATFGEVVGTISFLRLETNDRGEVTSFGAPIQQELHASQDVRPGTAMPMTHDVTWSGQEQGVWTVHVAHHDDVWVETRVLVDLYGRVEPYYG